MTATPAILLLVFNRPDTTRRVFASIRQARPARLYISGDGPRQARAGEATLCDEVRSVVADVDWPCQVETLFQDENLGCKQAVSGAISWFFRQEEEGIILEDDCLPGQEFYSFCAEMLSRYRDDERVWMITGQNFQYEKRWGEASYYFSKYSHIWGWACWRSTWARYDGEMSFWPYWKKTNRWRELFQSSGERRYWQRAFNRTFRGQINSWAYPWMASIWYGGGLTLTPNRNLVTNIGFGVDATHTVNSNSNMSIGTETLGDIVHTKSVALCEAADAGLYENVYREKFVTLVLRSPKILFKYLNAVASSRKIT